MFCCSAAVDYKLPIGTDLRSHYSFLGPIMNHKLKKKLCNNWELKHLLVTQKGQRMVQIDNQGALKAVHLTHELRKDS